MAASFLELTKDNLSALSREIFTKIKNTPITRKDIAPIEQKTFQNIIATATGAANAYFYFGSIRADEYNKPWQIKVRVKAYINAEMTNANKNKFYIDITSTICGTEDSYVRQFTETTHHNTGYRPIQGIVLNRITSSGYSAGLGHALGINLSDATSPTTATLKRDIEVEILETKGCTFTFFPNMKLIANLPSYSTANYAGVTVLNTASSGVIMSGDQNTYDRTFLTLVCFAAASDADLYGGQILLSADGKKYYSITKSRTHQTSHAVNQVPFDIKYLIYYNDNTTVTKGNKTSGSKGFFSIPIDFRYSSNCGNTLVSYQPVYLVATKDKLTGLYTLVKDNWWSQTPNQEGLYYINIGIAYSNYQVYFNGVGAKAYIYKDGILKEDIGSSLSVSVEGNTLKIAGV